MAIFKYLVTIDAASQSDADDVMSYRCGCDEQIEARDDDTPYYEGASGEILRKPEPESRWIEYLLWYEEVPDDQAG